MAITIPTATDGPPKRQLIELAFGELGSAGYEFGRTPEEMGDALGRLDALMLEWPWNQLGYVAAPYGLGSPDDFSGVKPEATNGVACALALALAPNMGATLSDAAKARLGVAVSRVYALTATIRTMPHDRHTPRGMGSRRSFCGPFIEEDFDDANPGVADDDSDSD